MTRLTDHGHLPPPLLSPLLANTHPSCLLLPLLDVVCQEDYVDAYRASMTRLADHWRMEAERQAEMSRHAGSAESVAKAQALQVRRGGRIMTHCIL